MKKLFYTVLAAMNLILISSYGFTAELVYQPVNPSFGGNPMNGGVLLGNAQAQDKYKNPDDKRTPMSNVDRLISSLNSRLLSKILSDAENDPGVPKSMITDEYQVVVEQVDGNLMIVVEDLATGERMTIEASGLSTSN